MIETPLGARLITPLLKAADLVEGRYPNLIVADSVAKATGERAGTSGNGGSTSSTI